MTHKPFEYVPVIINTVYDTTSNGMLLVRRTDDEQVTKLYIFENENWLPIDSNQVNSICQRQADENSEPCHLFQYNNEIQINIESKRIVKELISNKTYTLDLI